MAVVFRIILALSLLLQAFGGLTVVNCAEMKPDAAAVSATVDDAPCACCRRGEGAMTACPTGDEVVSCCCGTAQPQEPRTPPANPKTEQTQQFAALIPVLLAFLPAEPIACSQKWTGHTGPPMRSAVSIQSLLCVWIV